MSPFLPAPSRQDPSQEGRFPVEDGAMEAAHGFEEATFRRYEAFAEAKTCWPC